MADTYLPFQHLSGRSATNKKKIATAWPLATFSTLEHLKYEGMLTTAVQYVAKLFLKVVAPATSTSKGL